MAARAGLAFGISLMALAGGACSQEEFIGDGGSYAIAMTEETPAFITSEEGDSLFIVEVRVELPLQAPTRDELRELRQGAQGRMLPFDRLPWVSRGDHEIEVDWALKNLTDAEVRATLTLNGFNEFDEYLPGVTVIDDELVEDYSQWERHLVLEAFEHRTGTIREEQIDEVAVDLATVVNGAPNPNQVVYFENHSAIDVRSQPFIPEVIPALTGFRLGLRSTGANRLVLEATVRVRSDERTLAGDDEEPWDLPEPELFEPALAGMAMDPMAVDPAMMPGMTGN